MEDTDAKRNARRRRILENSEKRLLKITGLNGDTKIEDTSSQTSFLCRGMQEEKLQRNVNGLTLEKSDNRIKGTNFFESNNTWNNISTSPRDECDNARTKTEHIDNRLAQPSISVPPVLINRTNYVLLAFVVNILLVLELDYLFGKTLFIPYLPIMLVRLYIVTNRRGTQDNNLFYTALILCNIKPQLTYQFKKFMTVLHTMVQDLALYIFSFTAIHYVLFHCLCTTNTLTVLNKRLLEQIM
ncbi:uncharacterized protein LOC116433919 isoform X1 [Nomia melanderi]|uniref:uncharacterized protein LOC116433919 isoform X1 n=2 Tax=Nomia melanderi TaxID=2448451 RepID=UPI003FCD68A1